MHPGMARPWNTDTMASFMRPFDHLSEDLPVLLDVFGIIFGNATMEVSQEVIDLYAAFRDIFESTHNDMSLTPRVTREELERMTDIYCTVSAPAPPPISEVIS